MPLRPPVCLPQDGLGCARCGALEKANRRLQCSLDVRTRLARRSPLDRAARNVLHRRAAPCGRYVHYALPLCTACVLKRGVRSRDYPPCHICNGTGPTPATSAPGLGSGLATSAPGLGSALPHLHRDWARQVKNKEVERLFTHVAQLRARQQELEERVQHRLVAT